MHQRNTVAREDPSAKTVATLNVGESSRGAYRSRHSRGHASASTQIHYCSMGSLAGHWGPFVANCGKQSPLLVFETGRKFFEYAIDPETDGKLAV